MPQTINKVKEVKLKKACGRKGVIKSNTLQIFRYFPPVKEFGNNTPGVQTIKHLFASDPICTIWSFHCPEHGWNNESGLLEPLWLEGDTTPQQLLDILASNLAPDDGIPTEDDNIELLISQTMRRMMKIMMNINWSVTNLVFFFSNNLWTVVQK